MFVIGLIVLALYAAYPPVRVAVKKVRVLEKVATTEEEAQEHGVPVGDPYPVGDEEVLLTHFLPLARGERTEETEVVGIEEDGTVVKEVTTWVDGRIKLGLDIAGGSELLYVLKGKEGEAPTDAVGETIKILQQRIDPQNVKEYRIQGFGHNRILIQIPKASRAEVERLKTRLQRMGRLEFKLALPLKDAPDQYAKAARAGQKFETTVDRVKYRKTYVDNNPTGEFYLVKVGEPEITGQYLADASSDQDETGRPAVAFRFNAQGSRRFATITDRHQGWLLAMQLDGVLKSAPIIEERIAGKGIIRGDFTQQEVRDLVTVLRAGSLSVDMELLQESTVGPQLGRDSIAKGLRAIAVAGIIILVFIGIYYLSCGLVADAALLLNLVLLAGVLGLLSASLTLPGVAGILLTVGMAVDANVLIFERIREEAAAGKVVHVALRNGYDRAYTTIIDANVTTLLTAMILYMVGTGPVRGFAVTLSAGIVLSMFTSLYVTRLALETLLDKGWLKRFKMFSLIGRPTVSYTQWRRHAFALSVILVLIGFGAFCWRGAALYDVDFTGGTLVHLSLGQPMPLAEVRDMLAEGGFPNAEVQGIRTAAATEEGMTDFQVRIKGAGTEKEGARLRDEVRERLAAVGLLKVKGDEVSETESGRTLQVKLSEGVTEMALREALAGEGKSPFDVAGITDIVPVGPPTDGQERGRQILLRMADPAASADLESVWNEMLTVLAWSGLPVERHDFELGEIKDGPADPAAGEAAQISLKTDRPIHWVLLARELKRRGYPEIQIEPKAASAAEFVLTAPREVLERFRPEMPSAVNLPKAQIDGPAITGELAEPFDEEQVRSLCDQQGLGPVYVVALDARSKRYDLSRSYEQIRKRMGEIFTGALVRTISVEFRTLDETPDDEGKVRVEMRPSEPLTFAVVQHYLEEALGSEAREMIADDALGQIDALADVKTHRVTLRMSADRAEETQERIKATLGQAHPVQKVVEIGAVVAREMKGRALLAVVCAAIVIVFYVAVRFHALRFGVAAVIALIHDILITAGLIALADWSGVLGDVKINLAMLAAFLTILGYSLNDTIVVFDRIRENMRTAGRRGVTADIIDRSVNQTLSRTILTSLTTLAVVVVLYLVGGPVLQGLAFTLIIGVVVGTYSSVFIASPVLLDWDLIVRATNQFFRVLFLPVRAPFMLAKALAASRSGA